MLRQTTSATASMDLQNPIGGRSGELLDEMLQEPTLVNLP
jgi:hypothetical protein